MQDPKFKIPIISKALVDAINKKLYDVPYASDSDSQKLDIYFPNVKSGKPYPVIVYFHGGAFMLGTKRDDALEPMLRGTDRGYVVISAEYRKSGEARFPAMVYDAKAVIRYVRANAEKYNFDTDRIAVWGPSSGGWLASFLGVTNRNRAFEDLTTGNAEFSSEVNAVIDWCGPCGGFLAMDEAFKKSKSGTPDHDDPMSPESQFLGGCIKNIPELCRLSAPISHVSRHTPPFCIFHGEKDQVVPQEQSIAFAEAIKAAAGQERAELHIAEGKPHHGHPWYHEKWVSDACLDFLDKIFAERDEYRHEHRRGHRHEYGREHGHECGHEREQGEHCECCPQHCPLSELKCDKGRRAAGQPD
jgi:acetyl esterase/lipase